MLELKDFSLGGPEHQIVKNLSFKVDSGQILVIMGPSGSGKSSILQYIIGFKNENLITNGLVVVNGKDVTNLPPQKRNMGIMFQDDVLFPHLSVLQNLLIAIPKKYSVKEKKQLALTALKECQLAGFESRRIHTLSGGQKSRISLWRMLLSEPEVILLDEPFAKFDQSLKNTVRDYFKEIISAKKIPTVLVTHDPDDAKWSKSVVINLG